MLMKIKTVKTKSKSGKFFDEYRIIKEGIKRLATHIDKMGYQSKGRVGFLKL